MSWQPIETAPDDRFILVRGFEIDPASKGSNHPPVVVAMDTGYDEHDYVWVGEGEEPDWDALELAPFKAAYERKEIPADDARAEYRAVNDARHAAYEDPTKYKIVVKRRWFVHYYDHVSCCTYVLAPKEWMEIPE